MCYEAPIQRASLVKGKRREMMNNKCFSKFRHFAKFSVAPAALALLLTPGLHAQSAPATPVVPNTGGGIGTTPDKTTTPALRNWNDFLEHHPDMREALAKDPSLVDNPQFVNSHPELKQFLATHPSAAAEARANPNYFKGAEENYMHEHSGIGPGEEHNWDNYLSTHPGQAQALAANPNLIDDPAYVNAHPQLKEFLATHPGAATVAREHPEYFAERQREYDKEHPENKNNNNNNKKNNQKNNQKAHPPTGVKKGGVR